MPSPYSLKEPLTQINLEKGILDGFAVGAVFYGIILTLTIQCVFGLTYNPPDRKIRWPFVFYALAMLGLSTVGYFTQLRFCIENVFINFRNYPGGPLGYDHAFYSSPLNISGDVADFIMNWLADGLVLYRLYIIWERNVYIVAFPTLMFITSFSLSIVELFQVTRPGASLSSLKAINFGLMYWSISVSINILVTSLIVGRLIHMRRRMSSVSASHGEVYISVSAMLIESAFFYSAAAIIFLVSYGLQSPWLYSVESVEIIQGICPLMIIVRVGNGSAYTTETMTAAARISQPMVFQVAMNNERSTSGSRSKTYTYPGETLDSNSIVNIIS